MKGIYKKMFWAEKVNPSGYISVGKSNVRLEKKIPPPKPGGREKNKIKIPGLPYRLSPFIRVFILK
jgi:hypothetical protein